MTSASEILVREEAEAKEFAMRFLERTAHIDDREYELHNVDAEVALGTNRANDDRLAFFDRGDHLNEDFLRHASSI